MAISPRDENRIPAALAEDDDGNAATLKVDAVTGRLLVEVTADAGGATNVVGSNAKRDANRVPSILAEKDDGSGELVPIAVDEDGNLLCDLINE